MNLFDYFTGLAPAGETALIVKQIDTGKHHADGKRKYTWPAYYPTHKRKAGESWFLNTGSFIKDRMPEKPSAALANCTHVLFLMLDDIGETKVYDGESVVIKTPPVKPTAIVETSEGSYQYWFAYSEQPTVEEQTVFVEALGAADYTDRGARNAVRNCRLPGSVNRKPGKEEFICREVEFNPGVEYTIQELIAAFGVTPAEPGTARAITFRVKDNGADTVLAWLSENSLVLSGTNAAGWCGVVCPNHAEHTDGSIEARYKPQDRSFCCHHGHCDGLDSKFFCDWVAEQGGPRAIPGLRDDLIAEYTSKINKLTPTADFPDKGKETIADVERKQAGREERAGWHKRFAYIVDDDAYFDKKTCSEISRKAFNAIFRHIECKSAGEKPRRLEASIWYDENREAMGGYALKGLTYAAGEDWMVHKDGLVYGNVWRDARPEVTGGGDATPWLDHCRRLVPDAAELNHIWDVMAFKLQNPGVKINHAILHGGKGGCGKDTMWAPFIWSVCGPHEKNKGLIDNDSLSSQWGYQLEAEIVVLNELKEPEAKDRRALANKLKPIIAAPPETLIINRKGLHPYQMVNRLFMLAFTNEDLPITLDSDDRRWFCVWSESAKMTASEADKIWGWYKNGGFEAVAGWLYARDVSGFGPQAIPMMTEYKQKLIFTGMSNAESFIYHLIEKREAPFNVDILSGPWHEVIKEMEKTAPTHMKLVQPALFHALKEAGWVDKGLCCSPKHKSKRHIFVRPEMAGLSKSQLRDAVEPGGADNVVPLRHS